MALWRTLLIVGLGFSAAHGGELRNLKGETVTGELVSVSDKEIVFSKGGAKITVPTRDVVSIDLGQGGRIPSGSKYIDVELVDGSMLHCLNFEIKGKQVELTLLLTGQAIKLPLGAIANVLTNAQVPKYRKEWDERLHDYFAKKKRRDVLALLNDEVVNGVTGTIGDADADGKNLEFTLESGRKRPIAIERIHGLIFQRSADPQAAPILFKLSDSQQNLILVSAVTTTGTGLRVTSSAGAKLEYTFAQLAKLDYSKGKLAYLSDMKPIKETRTSNAEGLVLIGRDRNLDGHDPIVINRQAYAKGLALQAYTELEFDLDGDYREFTTMAGIDDKVKRADADLTLLRIEGDGKVLKELAFTRKNKGQQVAPITLNIKDVQKLRIVVSSGDVTDLGKHVTLADAKVSK